MLQHAITSKIIPHISFSMKVQTRVSSGNFFHFFSNLSRNCLFERINSLQCYELTRRCSHLLLFTDFSIDLCSAPLVCTLYMVNEAELETNFRDTRRRGKNIKHSQNMEVRFSSLLKNSFFVLTNQGKVSESHQVKQ